MDREQFDAIARLAWTRKSRRAALAALVGAALLGHGPVPTPAKLLAKRNRKGKKRNKAKKTKGKGPCYPNTHCIPGPGMDNVGCDFSFSTLVRDKDVHGSHLRRTNFRGADLAGADFRGTDLGGACFVGANLEGATLGPSVDLDGAIFCNTVMPDGRINSSGCGKTTACCPPLERDCPDATIACYTMGDEIPMCMDFIHRFPAVGHCWSTVDGTCCPCDHPDQSYWNDLCNQTFPDVCKGKCITWDEGVFFQCFSCPRP